MESHEFIFLPGTWIGEGKITFSASPDEVKFYTRWKVSHPKDTGISCTQLVELHGVEDQVSNYFHIKDVSQKNFLVDLENELIGKAQGKGVIDENTIAWEVRGPDNFEGYEVYERQPNGEYFMHAEYTSDDQFRTIIDGRIWKKSE